MCAEGSVSNSKSRPRSKQYPLRPTIAPHANTDYPLSRGENEKERRLKGSQTAELEQCHRQSNDPRTVNLWGLSARQCRSEDQNIGGFDSPQAAAHRRSPPQKGRQAEMHACDLCKSKGATQRADPLNSTNHVSLQASGVVCSVNRDVSICVLGGKGRKASVALWPMILGDASMTHGQGLPTGYQRNKGRI